jgi:hypothetical protein
VATEKTDGTAAPQLTNKPALFVALDFEVSGVDRG